MRLMITCHCCRGIGTIELTGEYALTYWRLAEHASEITGAELARKAGIKATAMNNRLAMLEKHGLAVSRRWGRKRLYKAAKMKGSK